MSTKAVDLHWDLIGYVWLGGGVRENDGRKLDHATLEALRMRAVRQRKRDRVGKAGITSATDLKTKALGALRRLQNLPQLVRAFFSDPTSTTSPPKKSTYLRTS